MRDVTINLVSCDLIGLAILTISLCMRTSKFQM